MVEGFAMLGFPAGTPITFLSLFFLAIRAANLDSTFVLPPAVPRRSDLVFFSVGVCCLGV